MGRTTEATLADVGEFGLIESLAPYFLPADHVHLGPGDDAAVLRVTRAHVVVSTDLLVEGRHFRRDWLSAEEVGHRAAAANLSDVNAMGGRAHSMTVGFAAPAELPVQWVLDFAKGLTDELSLVGAVLVGGDISRADQIVIAGTVFGSCARTPVLRTGARPGDVLALCGRQGWAAGGLAVLSRGFRSPRVLVEAVRHPAPPYDAGPIGAAAGATSMIDVSDGLLAEAGHVARASNVSIDITSAALEVAEPLVAVAGAVGTDPIGYVLTGGDDHPLLATFPADVSLPDGWRIIGKVGPPAPQGPLDDGFRAVTVDGSVYDGPTGWSHF
ncbi:MAG: thiamine-phosphate kinase [Nocardioides sp.]